MPCPRLRCSIRLIVVLVIGAIAIAGCGDSDSGAPAKAHKATAKPSSGAKPTGISSAPPKTIDVDEDELRAAAERFALAHADSVGAEPVEGPFPQTTRAAVWGSYEYATAALSTGSELDEQAYFSRKHGGDDQWEVARWIEAGDISGTCLLPHDLAALWAPDVAASPGCAPDVADVDPGAAAWSSRFRTLDGAVSCEAHATTSGPELQCWRERSDVTTEGPTDIVAIGGSWGKLGSPPSVRRAVPPKISAEDVLATATLHWSDVPDYSVEAGPFRCAATPAELTCIESAAGESATSGFRFPLRTGPPTKL